ncbi:MAG: hypothetical protein HQL53_00850 [Magnetococcales bacterium]|nr:hypothetical protein [Magnetococcales bacterium]
MIENECDPSDHEVSKSDTGTHTASATSASDAVDIPSPVEPAETISNPQTLHAAEQIASLMRADGTLKTDLICMNNLEALLLMGPPGDPLIVALCYLAHMDALRAFIDPPGNIGHGHFEVADSGLSYARDYLKVAAEGDYDADQADMWLRAFAETLDHLNAIKKSKQRVEEILEHANPPSKLNDKIDDLRERFENAEDDKHFHKVTQRFWSYWVVSWGLRINGVELSGIGVMRELYEDYLWLDRRAEDRRILAPPGGMLDPDVIPEGGEDDDGIELF